MANVLKDLCRMGKRESGQAQQMLRPRG